MCNYLSAKANLFGIITFFPSLWLDSFTLACQLLPRMMVQFLFVSMWTKLGKIQCTFNKETESEISHRKTRSLLVLIKRDFINGSIHLWLCHSRCLCYYFCLLSQLINRPDHPFSHWELNLPPFLSHVISLLTLTLPRLQPGFHDQNSLPSS